MERRFSVSDITFLNLITLTETEGYGSDDYMYWVKEQGIGQEGLFLLDSQDAVEEMIDHSDLTVLNIIVSKANEDRDVECNRAHNVCEEQIPIGSPVGGPGFVLSLSQDGVVHPLDVNLNTQQSCNLNISEANGGDDDGQAAGQADDDIDKSCSDFEIDRGDYRGIKMSYKAWKRGEENIGNEEERDVVEDRPQFI